MRAYMRAAWKIRNNNFNFSSVSHNHTSAISEIGKNSLRNEYFLLIDASNEIKAWNLSWLVLDESVEKAEKLFN